MKVLSKIGRYFLMLKSIFGKFTKWKILKQLILKDIDTLIIGSLGIVSFISFFVGGVVSIQTALNLENPLLPKNLIGFATRQSVILEFAPTFISIIMAGKVGSYITSSIGTMRVTEQIDALSTLSTDPIKYLVVPRLVAAFLTVPVLVGVGDSIGILGGYVVGVTRLEFNNSIYIINSVNYLEFWDILSGLVKGAVFGCIIALMGCFFGMRCEKGARGVGQATKSAVVSASVLILAANYFLTEIFFSS